MINKIKNQIVGYLKSRGYEKRNLTSREKVLGLIEKIRPISTNKELIRLGPDGDGGYLILDDLVGIEACFSPGVDTIAGFEEDCAVNYGMKIFMADKSVKKPPEFKQEIEYNFINKFIGIWNDEDYITLDEWVDKAPITRSSDLLIQMDIEGAEYFTLLNLSEFLQKRFRIITVEFHNLDKLWNPEFFELANAVFCKILKTHHSVHLHPNNYYPLYERNGIAIPPLLEVTFHRKERISIKGHTNSYPNKLDSDNTSNASITLPKIWQG